MLLLPMFSQRGGEGKLVAVAKGEAKATVERSNRFNVRTVIALFRGGGWQSIRLEYSYGCVKAACCVVRRSRKVR